MKGWWRWCWWITPSICIWVKGEKKRQQSGEMMNHKPINQLLGAQELTNLNEMIWYIEGRKQKVAIVALKSINTNRGLHASTYVRVVISTYVGTVHDKPWNLHFCKLVEIYCFTRQTFCSFAGSWANNQSAGAPLIAHSSAPFSLEPHPLFSNFPTCPPPIPHHTKSSHNGAADRFIPSYMRLHTITIH